MLPFYVYVLSRPDGTPFYVGMGQGDRMHRHEDFARQGDRSEKSHLIRKIWAAGGLVGKAIQDRFETDIEAKQFEIELIACLGRKDLKAGPLVNRTDGGDGVHGMSPQQRAHHASRTREAMADPKIRAACRSHIEQQYKQGGFGQKATENILRYWKDPVNRAAQAQRVKALNALDPDAQLARTAKRLESVKGEQCRSRMSAAKLGKKQSPELIAKRAAGIRRAYERNALVRLAEALL